MQKIKTIYLLETYLNKFFKRGQITFDNYEDAVLFQESLDILNIKRMEKYYYKNIVFTQATFFPHYLKSNIESPENCFSFN